MSLPGFTHYPHLSFQERLGTFLNGSSIEYGIQGFTFTYEGSLKDDVFVDLGVIVPPGIIVNGFCNSIDVTAVGAGTMQIINTADQNVFQTGIVALASDFPFMNTMSTPVDNAEIPNEQELRIRSNATGDDAAGKWEFYIQILCIEPIPER